MINCRDERQNRSNLLWPRKKTNKEIQICTDFVSTDVGVKTVVPDQVVKPNKIIILQPEKELAGVKLYMGGGRQLFLFGSP